MISDDARTAIARTGCDGEREVRRRDRLRPGKSRTIDDVAIVLATLEPPARLGVTHASFFAEVSYQATRRSLCS